MRTRRSPRCDRCPVISVSAVAMPEAP
ncbi:MAG: hypothetical protein AB7I59_22160 [Geminicoccaceae bacterium]